MINIIAFIPCVIIVLMAGCTINPPQTAETPLPKETEAQPILSPLPTRTSTSTSTSTPLPSDTPTPLLPSPTPTATSTPTTPPEARLKINCLEIIPDLPSHVASSGVIILDSRVKVEHHYNFETILLNMETRENIRLTKPNENLLYFAVSPDRRWIAYRSAIINNWPIVAEANLVIATADGQPQVTIPLEEGWGEIPGWLNDEQIVINIAGKDPDESSALKAATLMALNPFTGKRQFLRPDFPDIYDFPYVPNWEGYGITMYDPALTRVVYLRGHIDEPGGYALWDIPRKQELAIIDVVGDLSAIPRWSPDGQQFVVAPWLNPRLGRPNYELYNVSREGEITQLTNLTAYYPWIYIKDPSWSPDGRYIAFWLTTWSKKPDLFANQDAQHLAVLDMQTNEVTNYCVPGDYESHIGHANVPPPLWSPDGQQLIVVNRSTEDHKRVILVDIVRGLAAQIAEDMEPVGWMMAP